MRKIVTAVFIAIAALAGAGGAFASASVAQILDAYKNAVGGAGWNGRQTLDAEYDTVGYGLIGTEHLLLDLTDGRFVRRFTLGSSEGADGFDGMHPWRKDMSGAVAPQQGGDAVAMAVNQAYRDANQWWRADHGGAAIASAEKTEAGKRYHVLTITPKGGKAFDAWFDAESGLLGRIVERRSGLAVITVLTAYRQIEDIRLPGKIVADYGAGEKYRQVRTLVSARFQPRQPDVTFAAPPSAIDDSSIRKGAAATTLPIRLINNHIYGEVRIDGKGPFTFIFDTGGHNIVSPPLARKLGLKSEGTLPGTGAGEGVVDAGFTAVRRLEVGKAALENQTFVVLSLETLRDIEGVPMPGMIGYETFSRFVVRIDYGAMTLTLIDPERFDAADAGIAIPFTFNDHVPEVTGSFDGIPAKLDIDTGSRGELTLTRPFAEANALREKHPRGVDAVDGWGIGGPSRGYATRGAMTLGPIRIDDVVTTFSTQEKGALAGDDYQGNVGGGILKRFVVTFDYGRRTMYLKPLPPPVADAGTYDRAGMWFNDSRHGYVIVDVTAGSPAEKAGLKMGDVIVAVDGKSVEQISLHELRRRLRCDPPGTATTLKIRDGGRFRIVRLVLRDLI